MACSRHCYAGNITVDATHGSASWREAKQVKQLRLWVAAMCSSSAVCNVSHPTGFAITAEVSGWDAAAHLLELSSSPLTTLQLQSLIMAQQQHLAWVMILCLSVSCNACWLVFEALLHT